MIFLSSLFRCIFWLSSLCMYPSFPEPCNLVNGMCNYPSPLFSQPTVLYDNTKPNYLAFPILFLYTYILMDCWAYPIVTI